MTKFTALTWIHEFITLAKVRFAALCSQLVSSCSMQRKILPFCATIITAILPALSKDVPSKLRCAL